MFITYNYFNKEFTMNKQIRIEYDGSYPNLCQGSLVVFIGDTRYQFPEYCMKSGGAVWFDEEWDANVEQGEWSISDWPDNFPDKYKDETLEIINEEVEHGCCGGCI